MMAAAKTKPRNRLDVRNILQVSMSSIISRWEHLVAPKEPRFSLNQSCNNLHELQNIFIPEHLWFLKVGP